MGDEGLAHQHGVQLLPDGEKVWGVHRVFGADAVDPDIAPLVFVSGGLDEPMGRGYHLLSPTTNARPTEQALLGFPLAVSKSMATKSTCCIGGEGERLQAALNP